VHDLGGPLAVIEQLLARHGYTVESHQDELYRGIGIYLLYGKRGGGRHPTRSTGPG